MAGRPIIFALVIGTLAASLSGCFRERICYEGQQQVRSIAYPDEGRACTQNGMVPEGFETFPPEQRPTEIYVDEQP